MYQNPNVIHYSSLLEAEHAVAKGDPKRAQQHYQAAIEHAEQRNLLQDNAIARERYGDFLGSLGSLPEAHQQWFQAYTLFQQWGALGKAAHLASKRKLASSPAS